MSDSQSICPICNEGLLQEQVGKNIVDYKGQHGEVDLFYSVCNACGSEQSDASQLRANKRTMMAFRKRVDGLLSGSDVRALRKRLGISQTEAAKIFGGGPVAFSKYEMDDVAQSEAMDKLLRLVDAVPDALDYLRHNAGLRTDAAGLWTNEKVAFSHAEHHKLRVIATSTPMPDMGWSKCA
jgi:HTH-type transcriptional regulator/antitoxin MqsA